MLNSKTPQRPAARSENQSAHTAPAQADRLLTFRQVYDFTGNACKTGHAARLLAARGLIRCVRLNERCLRYTESSVRALVEGKVSA